MRRGNPVRTNTVAARKQSFSQMFRMTQQWPNTFSLVDIGSELVQELDFDCLINHLSRLYMLCGCELHWGTFSALWWVCVQGPWPWIFVRGAYVFQKLACENWACTTTKVCCCRRLRNHFTVHIVLSYPNEFRWGVCFKPVNLSCYYSCWRMWVNLIEKDVHFHTVNFRINMSLKQCASQWNSAIPTLCPAGLFKKKTNFICYSVYSYHCLLLWVRPSTWQTHANCLLMSAAQSEPGCRLSVWTQVWYPQGDSSRSVAGVEGKKSGLSESISPRDSDLWAAQTWLAYIKSGKHSKYSRHFLDRMFAGRYKKKTKSCSVCCKSCFHPFCGEISSLISRCVAKAVFDINASRVALPFKCGRTNCRCHCRRGFEAPPVGVQSATQPPLYEASQVRCSECTGHCLPGCSMGWQQKVTSGD